MSTKQKRQSSNGSDEKKAFLFLEELSWLLSSYSDVDLQNAVKRLRNKLVHESAATHGVGSYVSSNPNKHFLVGVLPRLFTDESLFPQNEDIAQFALAVMDVPIPNYQKKSRYEIIGRIVCLVNGLDDKVLSKLVHALEILTEDDENVKKVIKQRKDQNFGWNAIIQELATGKQYE